MMEITTLAFWGSLLEIFVINLILSGDNAVVIALATLHLKEKDRKKGIFWGSFGAVTLRLGLTLIALILLSYPFIQAMGGILLLFIACKLLKGEETSPQGKNNSAYSLRAAIKTIIAADMLMSLDNVLAVVGAAEGNLLLLLLGLAMSIPIVIFGSTFLSALMRKQPWLIYAGAGLLGYTAGKMILHDQAVTAIHEGEMIRQVLPFLLAIGVIITGIIRKVRENRLHSKSQALPVIANKTGTKPRDTSI